MPLTPRRARGKLVLTDAILVALSKRSDIVSAFPFFRLAKKAFKGSCGGCGGQATRSQRIEELSKLKATLAGLDEGQKELLKNILKAEQVTMHLPHPIGSITF